MNLDTRAIDVRQVETEHGADPKIAPHSGAKLMSNSKKPGKEEKKHSLLTPKEKKAAKQLKKHGGNSVPVLQRNP